MRVQDRPAVVMDCGTGYTKLGFAGNVEPCTVLPTALGVKHRSQKPGKQTGLEDMDVLVGQEALDSTATHSVHYPMRQGMVDNWDYMERFWAQCLLSELRVDPEEHRVVLTEPPLNPPEARELTAEVMFETFNVPGLYIDVQAVLALYAGFAAAEKSHKTRSRTSLSGTVIDSGDGVTHVIPVADGYVIGSSIKSIPLAGRDITNFIQQLMRERGEPVPPELGAEVARGVKERHGYIASDLAKEFVRHQAQPGKYVVRLEGSHPRTGAPWAADAGYERFLGPEVFFTPQIYSSDYTTPLPQVVDQVVQSCPIDTRRALYGNVVLSGGSTMFKDFGRRVQRDIKRLVDARTPASAQAVEVGVLSHSMQRYAVWFGGSVVGMMPDFASVCASREQYEEVGPSICRSNAVFKDLLSS